MGFRAELVNIGLLLPNIENPRHTPKETPEQALTALMDGMSRKIVNLAKDIVHFGLDPSAPLLVVEESGTYVSLEGNRRVAALLLLQDPTRIPLSARDLASFRELQAEGRTPEQIPCIVFDERSEADHWIELKHTGERDGVGTVRWGTAEQNRFRRNRGSQVDLAIQFADAVRKLFPHEPAFLADVDQVEASNSTTLGRIMANPGRRAQFGFERKDGRLYLRNSPSGVLPLLRRMFGDLSSGRENATNLRDGAYMTSYMQRILDETGLATDPLVVPTDIDDWIASNARGDSEPPDADADPGSGGDGPPEDEDDAPDDPSRRRRRDRAEKHIFQGIVLSQVDLRVSDVLKEAQRLDIDSQTNLAAVMIRVVLDLVTSNFYDHLGRKTGDNTEFAARLRSSANTIDREVKDPELQRARELIDTNGALSPKTMNGFVHNWTSSPLTHEVRSLSAAYGPFLRKIDEYMRQNPKK